MEILQVDPDKPQHVRWFLDLPFRLYARSLQWVPPLAMDARRALNRHSHPFYRHSEAAFFLALRDGEPIGRIAGLENRNYNAFNRERTAFFYLFECKEDREAACALFAALFDWAKRRSLETVVGPKGFSALDGMGLLVRGFEHRPAFGIPYNPVYYASLLEQSGFQAEGEVLSATMHRDMPFPEQIHRLAERVQARRGLRVARFHTRRELRSLVPHLGRLYNASLSGTRGNAPLTGEEIQSIAGQMIAFADPRLIKIVLKGDQPVGFLFAYPDPSAALQRTRGRLFPLGWLDIYLELRWTKWVNINGAGIVEEYRGLGGTALLFSEMAKSVLEGGFEHAELVQIGAENMPMQRELRRLGLDFHKVHRLYRCEP